MRNQSQSSSRHPSKSAKNMKLLALKASTLITSSVIRLKSTFKVNYSLESSIIMSKPNNPPSLTSPSKANLLYQKSASMSKTSTLTQSTKMDTNISIWNMGLTFMNSLSQEWPHLHIQKQHNSSLFLLDKPKPSLWPLSLVQMISTLFGRNKGLMLQKSLYTYKT